MLMHNSDVHMVHNSESNRFLQYVHAMKALPLDEIHIWLIGSIGKYVCKINKHTNVCACCSLYSLHPLHYMQNVCASFAARLCSLCQFWIINEQEYCKCCEFAFEAQPQNQSVTFMDSILVTKANENVDSNRERTGSGQRKFNPARSVRRYKVKSHRNSSDDMPEIVFSSFWFHISASVVRCPSAACFIWSTVHEMFSASRFTSYQLSSYQPVGFG